MGIKIGDTGLRIKYLQTFLKENYSKSVRVTGEYDAYTHKMLIDYLHSPDIADIKEVQKQIESIDNLLYYFIPYEKADCVLYKAKSSSDEVVEFMRNIQDNLISIVSNNGWELSNFVLYKSEEYNNVYQFTVKSNGRKNHFPKKDLLKYVNHNVDDYLISTLIDYDLSDFGGIDAYGRHFQLNSASKCKVMSASDINRGSHYSTNNKDLISSIRTLVIPCKPNTTYTIVCNVTTLEKYYNNMCVAGVDNNTTYRPKEATKVRYGVEFPHLFTAIASSNKTKENLMYSDVSNTVIWEYSVRPFDVSPVFAKLIDNKTGNYKGAYMSNKHIPNSILYTTSEDAKNILISYVCPNNKTVDVSTVKYKYSTIQEAVIDTYTNMKPYKMKVGNPPIDNIVEYSVRSNGINDFSVYEGDLLTEDVYMYIYMGTYKMVQHTYMYRESYVFSNVPFYTKPCDYMCMCDKNVDFITSFKKIPDYVKITNDMLDESIISCIDGTVINVYSDSNDINYLKSLLVQIYPNLENEVDGVYTENIRNAVLKLQQLKYCDASKEERKAYVKKLLENLYTADTVNLFESETGNPGYRLGYYTFDYITNTQIYNSLYSTPDGIFSYSPTAKAKGYKYFENLDSNTIEGILLNQSELDKIIDEVIENFPVDENTIIKQNVSMPNGYVDAETMQVILNKIKEMG